MFSLAIGKRVLKKDVLEAGIPAYSANSTQIVGYVAVSNLSDFSRPTLVWGIDGIFDWGYIPESVPFASTDHCGTLKILAVDLLPKYVYYELKATRNQYGFDRTYRTSLSKIRHAVRIRVPVRADGSFDVDAQAAIVQQYERFEAIQATLVERLESLAGVELNLDLG